MSESPYSADDRYRELDAWIRSLEADRPGPGPWFAPPPRSAWRRWGLNLLLLLLTIAAVYATGGTRLVVGLLSILLAHEMGHYVACRYYRVDATLPFFIPAPFLSFVGTLGAFIRIRAPIPHRRALFDIGIAGPLAGFVVCLPVLVLGLLEAQVRRTDPTSEGLFLGEPLLFKWAVSWLRGPTPDDMTLVLGPLGLAAWFGLFVTALNLIPVGQLDGGHVAYALFGRRARLVSRLAFLGCLGLLFLRPTWLVWCLLLLVLGRNHPPTLDDSRPVGPGRALVGAIGLLVFAACFTPSPIIVSWSDLLGSFTSG